MPDILKEGLPEAALKRGWVTEPEGKRLLAAAGIAVPRFACVCEHAEAVAAAAKIGYPLAAKVVSSQVVHKTDAGGVKLGIGSDAVLQETLERFRLIRGFEAMLIEEMLGGIELIVGATIDYQFGPVILLGMGGTGVEIYRDTAMRMAPLTAGDVTSMVQHLKARPLLEGFRGAAAIDMTGLTRLMLTFSDLVMAMPEKIHSIDLNPVICSEYHCVVADVRIML